MAANLALWTACHRIYGVEALPVYLVETVLFLGLLFAATARKPVWRSAIFGVFALGAWLLCGYLAVAILI